MKWQDRIIDMSRTFISFADRDILYGNLDGFKRFFSRFLKVYHVYCMCLGVAEYKVRKALVPQSSDNTLKT